MKKSESGEIMLEAVFCIIVTLFVIMFLLGLGFVLYQHALVTIVANEAAEEVSQTYKLINVEDSSNISIQDVRDSDGTNGIVKYRYYFSGNDFKKKAEELTEDLINSHIGYTSLASKENSLNVDVKVVKDDVGRRHYVIVAGQKYGFLFGNVLKLFGLWDKTEITAESYVMGVDVLHHVNAVKNGEYIINELEEDISVIKAFGSIISFTSTFVDIFDEDVEESTTHAGNTAPESSSGGYDEDENSDTP